MATWNKSKVNSSDVNNGNQFNAGDGVRNTDINKIFESGLYSQDIVENIGIGTVTTSASGSNANANVTYDKTTGYPKINLTLPRGEKGEKGDQGSVGNLKKLLYSGDLQVGSTYSFNTSTTSKLFLIVIETEGRIVDTSSGWANFCLSTSQAQDLIEEKFYKFEITNSTITPRDCYKFSELISEGTFSSVSYEYLSTIWSVKVYSLEF